MATLTKLVTKRKSIRSRVTICHNRCGTYNLLSEVQRAIEKANLIDYQTDLENLDDGIETLKFPDSEDLDESELQRETDSCVEYRSKIKECLAIIEHLSSVDRGQNVPYQNQVEVARSLLKQPVAPLPKFSGVEHEDLVKFLREFELTTANYNYPNRDLLLLLIQQVSGRAKTLLNSLEADKQTYEDAKGLLISAFASPETRKFSTIQKLSELSMNYKDDPFDFISKVKMLSESIHVLNIVSEDFLQYFVWSGLNESFKNHLIQITGKTKPSFKEIVDSFFSANERYAHTQKQFKTKFKQNSYEIQKESVTTLATKVHSKPINNFKNCSLCAKINKPFDHPIFRCQIFKTSSDKLEKIKSFKGCIKCASLYHPTEDCKFRFHNKCRNCSKWHFSFICPQMPKNTLDTKKEQTISDKSECNSGVVVLHSGSCNSILPTFSFKMFAEGQLWRGLKDCGSQSSFITEKLASLQKLKTLKDDITLTVNGFNAPQLYRSRLVEVPLYSSDGSRIVPALVIPEIKVNLKIDKLGDIVKEFKERGYSLADSFLNVNSRSIHNIDFLLGADASYCIVGKDILFGETKSSMYIDSSIGILLLGKVNALMKDLSCLPVIDNEVGLFAAEINLDDLKNSDVAGNGYLTHSFFVSNFIPALENHEIVDLDYKVLETNSNIAILNKGKINEANLLKATDEILEAECRKYINYDSEFYKEETTEHNQTLVDYTLNNMDRSPDGRLRVPLLWNGKVSHLLSQNYKLSKLILKSNLKKLNKNSSNLKLVDQTIKDQLHSGIIEKIDNINQFIDENPCCSFLPHMPIFKFDRETTKCRIVFLSNLNQIDYSKALSISHNQAMFAGPTLNQKLSSALLHLRFGKYLLTYDLKKAFNQLLLHPNDQSKLAFLWFRNIDKEDFSIVAYKNTRLTFGLRCSPFLLMISLYYILVLNSEGDPNDLKQLKLLMYSLLYMDNGAITSDCKDHLRWSYGQLDNIFFPYKFEVQQLITNDKSLQSYIDRANDAEIPDRVKLFGLTWDRKNDTLFTKPIALDINASTKRTILQSIASQFDIYNFNMPVLNRSRLFMHELQNCRTLGWDDKLSPERQKEWGNICKQVNAIPEIKIPRFMGPRDGTYKLIAYTDASHALYGTVIYLQHVESGKVSFVLAKNRMINLQLKLKSIPSLEFNAITLGVETLMEVYRDLAGPTCLRPIRIVEMRLYTDSLCCLHWLNAAIIKLDKMQKRSVFIMNRLKTIEKMCEIFPVKFCFVSGKCNPADCVTRCISFNQLKKSNFLEGPDPSNLKENTENCPVDLIVTIPNPLISTRESSPYINSSRTDSLPTTTLIAEAKSCDTFLNPVNFSSFHKLVLMYRRILICVQKWKTKCGLSNITKFENTFTEASIQIIRRDQLKCFPEVFKYFKKSNSVLADIPPVVSRLNVFLDNKGLLRVKCKFKKWQENRDQSFPILLDKTSHLTEIIILDIHKKLAHMGCYSILSELRKQFYIPSVFSTVKRCLKLCIHCKRFNARTIKLNQSDYREFRSNPPQIPFANIFIDYLGPFTVKKNEKNEKIWLLCITCTWSRAINLKICHDLTVKEFLRAFQMHCFEYGIPQLCVSDLGSQLTAGINILTSFLSDAETHAYFEMNKVKPLTFQQYFKGCSQLGSLVEICVKLTKRLIFGSIKNNILSYYEFEFLVCNITHLANRRPIAFKESLRESEINNVPEPITPELLIRGYELTSINLIPDLQDYQHSDIEWQPNSDVSSIKNSYSKLRKVRSELIKVYQEEFLGNLIAQAVDRKDRYRPTKHKHINEGDIVLLKEQHTKPNYFPLGIVKQIVENDNGEVTGAIILKGKTNEQVKRHVTTLIPLLENKEYIPKTLLQNPVNNRVKRNCRKAAIISKEKTKQMLRSSVT